MLGILLFILGIVLIVLGYLWAGVAIIALVVAATLFIR